MFSRFDTVPACDGRTDGQTDRRTELTHVKSEKHHISSSRSNVRRAISTKFCLVIEVVRAIILGRKLFWVPSTVLLPIGGVENLAGNAPYLAKLCRLRTRIKVVNFVKIVQGTRPLGAVIEVKFHFFSFGAVNPTPGPIKVKFGMGKRTYGRIYGPLLHAKFHLDRCTVKIGPARE